MNGNGINNQGFITGFFTAGPFLSVPETEIRDKNQLSFEAKLRAEIAGGASIKPESGITAGKDAGDGQVWQLAVLGSEWFIDKSTFYHLLRRVEMKAYTRLESDRPREVNLICWTYTAADIWVNGEKALSNTPAVYKPIKRQVFTAKLKKGLNEIFIRMQSLGARDTRTLLALQFEGNYDGIRVNLPGVDGIESVQNWLSGLKYKNGRLISESVPPVPMKVGPFFASTNASHASNEGEVWKTGTEFTVDEALRIFAVSCTVDGTPLLRRFDIYERMKPKEFSTETDFDKRAAGLYMRGPESHYPFPVIMHFKNGTQTDADYERLKGFLELIDRREDCSDFYMNSLFRLFKKMELPEEYKAMFRNTALNYRYWMDEDGADGMCFWSENHALLFFSNQYLAGAMYPDDTFTRSRLTGKEVCARGRQRCDEWLSEVIEHGFEEFASSSYAVITSCALLSIIDYGEKELAEKAVKVLDRLINQLTLHVFDGAVVAPQGRAYRNVLQLTTQATGALMNLFLPGMRDTDSTWLGAFAMSDYKPPKGLEEAARKLIDTEYPCGNAHIRVKRAKDYLLTSCVSPAPASWDPISETDEFSYKWIRSLNERFHGTTFIRPGVYGYQQHLMYAALSAGCASFVSHPGGASDSSLMRPGYWNGNGIMPALCQKGSRLGIVYNIADRHPISFTHAFWPNCTFDESEADGHYLFGRVNDGYMALWTSGEPVPYDDFLISCEYRVYGRETAWLYTMGSRDEYGSFEAFKAAVKKETPEFDGKRFVCGDLDMTYTEYSDDTQFV